MARAVEIEMRWDDGMHHLWSRQPDGDLFDLALTDPSSPTDPQPLRISDYDLPNMLRVLSRGIMGDVPSAPAVAAAIGDNPTTPATTHCVCHDGELCGFHATWFQRYMREKVRGLLDGWDEAERARTEAEKTVVERDQRIAQLEEKVIELNDPDRQQVVSRRVSPLEDVVERVLDHLDTREPLRDELEGALEKHREAGWS